MTPAILELERRNVLFELHEYANAQNRDYALEAVEQLQLNPAQVFKTLIVQDAHHSRVLGCMLLPAQCKLSLKKAARQMRAKSLQMADAKVAERSSGYVLGGISPLGQKKTLPTWIDQSATTFTSLFVSAGRRGLEIELAPQDLINLSGAQLADLT